MKVVLTGATGLIGNALGRKLVADGHQVVALVRNIKSSRTRLSFPCELREWIDAKAFEGADALVHLAGENVAGERWSEERKRVLRESRISTARDLAKAMRGQKLQVFIGASAIGIYGNRGDEILDRASMPGSDFLSKLCVEWELASDEIPALRTVKARFGLVLSDEGGFIAQVAPMFARLGASRLGSGKQWFSWIHADDAARVLARALTTSSIHGPINVVAPGAVTNQMLTDTLGEELGAFRAPPVPGLALRLLYGEMADALLASQRVAAEKGFEFQYAELKPALDNVLKNWDKGEIRLTARHWVPVTPIELEKALAELREDGWIAYADSLGSGSTVTHSAPVKMPLGRIKPVQDQLDARVKAIDAAFYPR